MKNKWMILLIVGLVLPFSGSALVITRSQVNSTTDNDIESGGDAVKGSTYGVGSASVEVTGVGSSSGNTGARFTGAVSGRGVYAGSQTGNTISQSIDVTVTWTVTAEEWEEYSISLTPFLGGYANILDDSNSENGDYSGFGTLNGILKLNGNTVADTLNLSGYARTTVGGNNFTANASQTLSGLTGDNTISLQYTGTARVDWFDAFFQDNRTANAVLWGSDGTMDGDSFSDSFDNYSSSTTRDGDGIIVDADITLDAVPEPASALMIGTGALMLGLIRRFYSRCC